MHKLFKIHDLTNIINNFVSGDDKHYCSIIPTNNNELYLCDVFTKLIVSHTNDLQKMENYNHIKNMIISDKISLFPKKLTCLYIDFQKYYESPHAISPLYPANKILFSNVQKNEEETGKIVSWLESIYVSLPSSLVMIGFTGSKINSVILKSLLPKSVKHLNIDNGHIANMDILTQITMITLSGNKSINGFPDNIETILFANKNCQQKITKLPKNLKTIDLYANKNHPFKRKNYDENEHMMPNINIIIANLCIFEKTDRLKFPEKLDKLIIYPCTCYDSLDEFVVIDFVKHINVVFEFRKNTIRACG